MVLTTHTRWALALSCFALTSADAAAAEPEPMPEAAEPEPVQPATDDDGLGIGLGLRLGLDVPTSKLGPFVVGALELDFLLPVLERRLVLGFDFSYTAPSYDGGGADPRVGGDYDYTIVEKELKLALDLGYRFFTEDRPIIPYVGIGFVIQLLETVETLSFGPRTDHLEQSTELGFEIFGGVDFRAGPGFIMADLRFVHTGLDHDMTGNVNAGNFTLCVGYRFLF